MNKLYYPVLASSIYLNKNLRFPFRKQIITLIHCKFVFSEFNNTCKHYTTSGTYATIQQDKKGLNYTYK